MRRLALPLLLALLAPLPALAGTVYVPGATHLVVGKVTYRTGVWVSNPSDVPRRFTTAFIASDTNGTRRPLTGAAIVPAKGSLLLTNVAPLGGYGMLEINGAPQLVMRARLDAIGAGGKVLSSTPVPVVTSENWVPAGRTAHLQGLGGAPAGRVASVGLLNLAWKQGTCTVEAYRPSGARLGRAATVAVAALSHRQLQRTLAALGATGVPDARIEATCDRPFYLYATQLSADGSQAVFVGPSGRLLDMAQPGRPDDGSGRPGKAPEPPGPPPGETPPSNTPGNPPGTPPAIPPAAPGAQPAGTVIWAPGVFLDVRKVDSYKAYELPLDLDVKYKKLIVDFDLDLGRWQSIWYHGITSLKRNDKTLYYGILVKGAPTKTILDLGRERQTKESFGWRENSRYHVRTIYDVPARKVVAQFSQNGQVVHQIGGKMTNADLRAFGNYRVRIDFGLPGVAHSAYFPAYGSQYSNLEVRLER
ncbi:MAG TPA: hypothetical protein VF121_07415 [Thermoanaerobaculia bacterium]|nr:hypothetical protein [Thermoanaerobaculia bacterium]